MPKKAKRKVELDEVETSRVKAEMVVVREKVVSNREKVKSELKSFTNAMFLFQKKSNVRLLCFYPHKHP